MTLHKMLKLDDKLFSKRELPSNNVKRTVTYESKKLVTKFNLKDKKKFHQQNNIIYWERKYPYETCTEDCIVGNTEERNEERTIDRNRRDKNLHISNQSGDKNHQHVWENGFRVLGNN